MKIPTNYTQFNNYSFSPTILFSSLKKDKLNINYSDYKTIKTGSYKKLLKSYYKEKESTIDTYV